MFALPSRASRLRRLAPGAAGLLLAALVSGCATTPGEQYVELTYKDFSSLRSAYVQPFTQGRADGWQGDRADAWQVADKRYAGKTDEGEASTALYYVDAWADTFTEVDIIDDDAKSGEGGLVIRASPDFRFGMEGSGYIVSIAADKKERRITVLRQIEGGMADLLEAKAVDTLAPGTNRLAILAEGDHLHLYINGEPVWDGKDGAIVAGRVGFFVKAGERDEATRAFDNLTVKLARASDLSADELDRRAKRSRDAIASAAGSGGARLGQDRSPRIRPGFLVRVTVYAAGKPSIETEAKRVSDNNKLEMPLIGRVSVDGMTLTQLNSTLEKLYRDYFIDPQVLAEFVVEDRPDAISPWGSVVVLGRVRQPGRVNIPPTQDLTVSGAIQQAGGLDTSARQSAIRLTRRGSDGSVERLTIDFSAIGERGAVENDLVLKPGDQIFVPESIF